VSGGTPHPGHAGGSGGAGAPREGSPARPEGLRRPDPAWQADAYRAPLWARSPHGQTLAGRAFRRAPSLRLRRERWSTPDGDFLDLDFVADAPHPTAPLVLVLHGLEGHARRGYVGMALEELHERGMAGVGLNFRGCSGEPNRTPRAYHSGETGDLAFVLGVLTLMVAARKTGTFEAITLEFSQLNDLGLSVSAATLGAAALLLFIGATGKSAQIPLHLWLPDAMAGPTPVSALIHAATMVTAGIYMIARLNGVFMAGEVGGVPVLGIVAMVGVLTAFFAGAAALGQDDIKKYSEGAIAFWEELIYHLAAT